MAQAILRNIAGGLIAASLLAGCVEGTGGNSAPVAGPTKAAGKAGGSKDVEAPELFQTTDTALWDGRPSLGGIWVASPEAKDPERVVIVNTENGKSVTGGLFRRERENPGPRLQISSDAAEALGVLAGQPVKIRVTALRREEVAPVSKPAVEVAPAEKIAEKPAEVKPAEAKPADAKATVATAAAALDAADAKATAEPAAEAKPKTWKERRAEAKAAREAKKAAEAAAKAEAEAAKSADIAKSGAKTDNPVVSAVETAPLDTPATATKPKAEKVAEQPKALQTPAATKGRTIQVGTFSKEENATRAVDALAKIGITARIRKSGPEAKPVWSVLVTGDAAVLNSIKSAGFADAYFLS